jgi:hypothetical protein
VVVRDDEPQRAGLRVGHLSKNRRI